MTTYGKYHPTISNDNQMTITNDMAQWQPMANTIPQSQMTTKWQPNGNHKWQPNANHKWQPNHNHKWQPNWHNHKWQPHDNQMTWNNDNLWQNAETENRNKLETWSREIKNVHKNNIKPENLQTTSFKTVRNKSQRAILRARLFVLREDGISSGQDCSFLALMISIRNQHSVI